MPELNIEHRLYFNGQPATSEQLERVDRITVEQEIGMIWEGKIRMPLRLDERGTWVDDDEDFMQPYARVRVEVRIGNGSFVPLIDGPVVGHESSLSPHPGESFITLLVHDDSTLLDREDRIARFEGQTDSEIANEVFGEFRDRIRTTDIQTTPASGSSLTSEVYQRGTAMRFLRSLARRNGMYACVLPGDRPGQSIGIFRPLPTRPDGLSPLRLLGQDRNIEDLTLRFDARRPARVSAASLRITDGRIITGGSGYDSITTLGDRSLMADPSHLARVILPPRQGESVDLDGATQASAVFSSYALEARGRIREDHYTDVLSPYRIITLQGGTTRMSGDYLIAGVTHTLTRNSYSQTFRLERNAGTGNTGGGGDTGSSRGTNPPPSQGRGVF